MLNNGGYPLALNSVQTASEPKAFPYVEYLELTGLDIPAEDVDSPIIEEYDEATTGFSFNSIITFVANAFKWLFGSIFKNNPMPIK